MRFVILSSIAAVVIGSLTGCFKHEKPNFVYMPDMADSPAYKAQEEGSLRTPPAGTVSRNQVYSPYQATEADAERAGRELMNPLKKTKSVLERGKSRYNIYCIVCHGAYGEGDGSIVPKFPRPPTLQSDRVKNFSDGRIFHIVTHGQNLMPGYALQLEPEDRWAVIHYLRVLYRAKHPTPEDLKKLETW